MGRDHPSENAQSRSLENEERCEHDIGIPRCYLTRMCDEGLLIKVGYGIYRATDQEAA